MEGPLTERLRRFEISSVVPAPVDAVWARIASMDGVNHELGPFLRMTYPPEAARFELSSVPIGTRAFRSWMLLFGVLPIDWDDLTFERFEPGRGFSERSSMLTQRTWRHERTLEAVPAGTRVTDRVAWEGRVPGVGAVFGLVVPWLFRWRHRRLGLAFGAGRG